MLYLDLFEKSPECFNKTIVLIMSLKYVIKPPKKGQLVGTNGAIFILYDPHHHKVLA